MQNNRSDSSAMPGDPNLSEQALLEETDLRRCIESLQWIICDLLSENEKLRQLLAGGSSYGPSNGVSFQSSARFWPRCE
jgi:hypothetical protein